MIRPDELEVVVPSAHAMPIVSRTFPALGRALEVADLGPEQVTVVDERPERQGLPELLDGQGFKRLVTGGLGNGPARNRGVSASRAPWLLFVDDDVELDPTSVEAARRIARRLEGGPELAAIGGLRAPAGSPDWLGWAYEDEVVNTASASAPSGLIGSLQVSVTLLLIHRDVVDAVGGFPEVAAWGWIDAQFGLRLRRHYGAGVALLRDPSMSGVHLYEPTWEEWLDRMRSAGRRLSEVCQHLPDEDVGVLLEAVSLGGRPKHRAKRALASVPDPVLRRARGRLARRLAASAAFAAGHHSAS